MITGDKKKILALIPAYNEGKFIGKLIEEIKNYIEDILVIDDGSIDNTQEQAFKNGAQVIKHKKNCGKGAALKTGFEYAISNNYDSVLILDGDGQHDPRDIPSFLESYEDADILIGNRMNNVSKMPLIRYLTNKVTSGIISFLIKKNIEDSQCGYRLIKTEVLKNIGFTTSKFDFESEILLIAGIKNYRIKSVPIKTIYYEDNISFINPVIDTFRFIRLIVNFIFKNKI